MAIYGYVKSISLEYDPTVKKKIDCKDCMYYEHDDKSCMKRPLYMPEDGYDLWKNCKFFELDPSTSNYDVKKIQAEKYRK